MSGQLPIDPKTGNVPEGIEAQTRQALANVRAILEEAGSSLELVVKVGVYLKELDDFVKMNAVYAAFFPDEPPARSTSQNLLPSKYLIMIDAIALKS